MKAIMGDQVEGNQSNVELVGNLRILEEVEKSRWLEEALKDLVRRIFFEKEKM
jgi:hypothetical protein